MLIREPWSFGRCFHPCYLKVNLSIFDKNDPFPQVKGNVSKKFKESGVKKVFILALVPGIQENYVNVKRIWINLQLHLLQRYTIATDLKLCNILLGIMSHASCHPRCWCDIHKDNLNRKGIWSFSGTFLGQDATREKQNTTGMSYTHQWSMMTWLGQSTQFKRPGGHVAR